jgi:CRISPR/Cas system CMR-associated protein Cmr5 small subunit
METTSFSLVSGLTIKGTGGVEHLLNSKKRQNLVYINTVGAKYKHKNHKSLKNITNHTTNTLIKYKIVKSIHSVMECAVELFMLESRHERQAFMWWWWWWECMHAT